MITSGLKDGRVLVTGASRGIGFAAAKAFLNEGANVVINSSNNDRLRNAVDQLSSLGQVHGVAADLATKEGIEELLGRAKEVLGGIDTLVYVTGSPKQGPFMDQEYEDWENAAKLLTVSPAYLSKGVADMMISQGVHGRLVLLASSAIREPLPNVALSNVCRIAIAGIVRTLARELGPKQIRVNGILPGSIRTSRTDEFAQYRAKAMGITPAEVTAQREKEIPMGYIGSPEELARSIVFLGSDMSSYVTGVMLLVDGGLMRSVG